MKKILLLVIFGFLNSVFAAEYLGLNLGIAKKDEIMQQLTDTGATFDDNYGYKGYSKDLPYIKVSNFDKFTKFGDLNDAWLQFTPSNILYKIEVHYKDAGETFQVLKDALDSKYGKATVSGGGFETQYLYKDKKTEIYLLRNTFGFGKDQKTSMMYLWAPSIKEVNKMINTIENDIKNKNAKKASQDL